MVTSFVSLNSHSVEVVQEEDNRTPLDSADHVSASSSSVHRADSDGHSVGVAVSSAASLGW